MKKNFKGKIMHSWLQDLYPIHRSITGEGLRKTLKYLKKSKKTLLSVDITVSNNNNINFNYE